MFDPTEREKLIEEAMDQGATQEQAERVLDEVIDERLRIALRTMVLAGRDDVELTAKGTEFLLGHTATD